MDGAQAVEALLLPSQARWHMASSKYRRWTHGHRSTRPQTHSESRRLQETVRRQPFLQYWRWRNGWVVECASWYIDNGAMDGLLSVFPTLFQSLICNSLPCNSLPLTTCCYHCCIHWLASPTQYSWQPAPAHAPTYCSNLLLRPTAPTYCSNLLLYAPTYCS